VTEADADGRALVTLPENSTIFAAVSAIAQATLQPAMAAKR
jgi:hypothetical protein